MDFIEQLMGIWPDGGNGMLEAFLLGLLPWAAAALLLGRNFRQALKRTRSISASRIG